MALERDIENLLEQLLVQNGWVINVNDTKKNVYHQKPKTKEDKQKLKGLEPDFCLYLDKTSISPEIILETKKPNMNLAKTFSYQNLGKMMTARLLQILEYWIPEPTLQTIVPIKKNVNLSET